MKPHFIPSMIFAMAIAGASHTASAIEMSGPVSSKAQGDAAEERLRYLHGDLISLSNTRELKTSVGEFKLSPSARLLDRRLNQNAAAKVSISFEGQQVKQVIIYQ